MNKGAVFYETRRDNTDYFCISETCCDAHFHRSVELLYCIKGKIETVINGREGFVSEGELLFLPPMTVHKYLYGEGNRGLCVVMPMEYGDIYEEAAKGRSVSSFEIKKGSLSEDVYYHMNMLENASPLLKKGIYCYITAKICEEIGFCDDTKKSDCESFSFKLLSFIEGHYNEAVTLGSVARELGYSRCYFSTMVQKSFKTGFPQLLGSVRVRKTAAMLGDLPACEVAAAAGFNNVQSYYDNFKRTLGITPGEYKKKYFQKSLTK